MGLFKQTKDTKDMAETAPEMASVTPAPIEPAPAAPAGTVSTEPIAGVSLPLFVEISKGLAAYDYDQSKGVEVAASKGVSAESWGAAVAGWNDRIMADLAIAREFNRLYTGR